MEDRIGEIISHNGKLEKTAIDLHSITGIGPIAGTVLIAEMHELGSIAENVPSSAATMPPSI